RYANLDAASGGVPPLQRERDLFGSDHAEVGAWLAARWNLPAYLQRIIGQHESGPCRDDPELACASGSGLLAGLWLRAGGPEELREIATELERRTGLSGVETARMLERMSASAPELASLFEIRLEPHEARGLHRQALELMVVRNLVEVRDAA